jgi:hypothetical protein
MLGVVDGGATVSPKRFSVPEHRGVWQSSEDFGNGVGLHSVAATGG